MFFRKYLAFYNSTFPWIWCIIGSWWLDRLFVELGHRYKDSEVCTHNDLQYVYIHQYLTTAAIIAQSISQINSRKKQFNREVILTGSTKTCLIHIYLLQIIFIVGWTSILSVLLDVSPWLCKHIILENRACIATVSFFILCITSLLETKMWDWSLQRGLMNLDDI
tara:strand:+ start:433 stop:927 length:495 start_codon:yes stop_codon:yes gene_type:complete